MYKIKAKRVKQSVREIRVGFDMNTQQVLLSFPFIEARLSPDNARQIATQLQMAADKIEPKQLIHVV